MRLFWSKIQRRLYYVMQSLLASSFSPLDSFSELFSDFILQDSFLRERLSFGRMILQTNLCHPLFLVGKLSEMKSTWSPGPISHSQASLSHELWKVPQGPRSSTTAPSRPPPGLTNTKPSSTWGGSSLGLGQGWSSSYTTGSVTKRLFCLQSLSCSSSSPSHEFCHVINPKRWI